jgi:hypothetical protein
MKKIFFIVILISAMIAAVIFYPNPVKDIGEGDFTVTLSVSAELAGGEIIFSPANVVAAEGDSVFDVLQREMRNAGIHMEFSNNPLLNSVYVMGINNIYEFDEGALSGWMYKVNGDFPGMGASQFVLQNGDVIEWLYTLDLGRDVGNEYE